MSMEITLVVDEENQKVLFAECDHEFVDVLLSFLTLPLGTIVKLLDKQSEFGCLDKLYQSVQDLDAERYLQTPRCKAMLLSPKSIAAAKWEGLGLNICDYLNLKQRTIYWCQNWECAYHKFPYYSSYSGAKCGCGMIMDKSRIWPKTNNTSDGVFVRKGIKYLVSDDLHVSAVSSIRDSISFVEKYNTPNPTNLKKQKIQINKSQVLHLLKKCLLSKTPLTDVFFERMTDTVTTNIAAPFLARKIKTETLDAPIKKRQSMTDESASTKVKIFESSKVLLVEAGNDFVDLAFSFLTFPLGLVISLLGESFSSSSPGCIHHIHQNIDSLFVGNDDRAMLSRTKLPPYYSCSKQILKVDESEPKSYSFQRCGTCYRNEVVCSHGIVGVPHTELNPKLVNVSSKKGGGFARTNTSFIVTNDMVVKPLYVFSTMELLTDFGASVDRFKEREITIDETKALSFLKACLTSNTGVIENLLK